MRSRRDNRTDDQDTAELAAFADGSLPPERRAAVEARVVASDELTAQLGEQQRALALLQSAAGEVEAPAALRARIDARRRSRRTWAPRSFALVGAAAAAVLALGIGIAALRSGSSGEIDAALSPTALAPGVTGRVELKQTKSGWRIELYAEKLARLDDGRFYEAWLRNDAGRLVPIGTFNEGREVVLWAGVSPKSYSTITVTRERADGDQGPSGQKVLVGQVETG